MNPLRALLRLAGRDLVRVEPGQPRSSLDLAARRGITLVLDVGANTGQFARRLRRGGYKGRIVCFEPVAETFRRLEQRMRGDAGVTAVQAALGAVAGEASIHLAADPETASMLASSPRLLDAAPGSRNVGTQAVRVETLDGVLSRWQQPGDRIFLKVDTQGYEQAVLDGARASLPGIDMVQLELSLVPLYEGAPSLRSMLARMEALGFEPAWFEPVFTDPSTGQLLQVDVAFLRPSPSKPR